LAASSVRESAPCPNRPDVVGVRRCSARPDRVGEVCDEHARVGSELGHPDAQKLLSGSMARLAYNGQDGFPRVIPVGFYWTGERIVVSTAPDLPEGPRAFVPPGSRIDDRHRLHARRGEGLLVRGLATLETVDGVTDEYLAAARRTMDESQLAEFERNVRFVIHADGAYLDRAAVGAVL